MTAMTAPNSSSMPLLPRRDSSSSDEPSVNMEIIGTSQYLYESEIFTIVVGADEQRLSAHESVLSQSPVLRRMCQGGFLESSTKRIELKEDDPEVFSIVLTYLYRGDYEPLFPLGSVPVCKIRSPENLKSRRDKHAMESALVYIMADKYQIEELKIAAVQKLKNLQPLSFQAFLALSLQVYRSLPESDLHFRGFFAKVAPCQLTGAAEDIIRPYIKEGGLLAEDMLFALRTSIIAPAFAKSSIPSEDFRKWLFSSGRLVRTIYQLLDDVPVRRSCSEETWTSDQAQDAGTDDNCRAVTSQWIEAVTKHGFEEVHAAGEELSKMGIVRIRTFPENQDEYWDVNPRWFTPVRRS